jgi:hypothetical protein
MRPGKTDNPEPGASAATAFSPPARSRTRKTDGHQRPFGDSPISIGGAEAAFIRLEAIAGQKGVMAAHQDRIL